MPVRVDLRSHALAHVVDSWSCRSGGVDAELGEVRAESSTSSCTAFLAHGRVLRHKRDAKAFTKLPDAYAFAAVVARAGYATDTAKYETELQAVMRTIERAGWKG